MNILCQVSSVKVGGKPAYPVTVGGIQLQMTEYLRRKLWIQKKTELLYLVMDVVLPESFDQDATLATQFDKKIPKAPVCADTGAIHSVAGEKLHHLLKQEGLNFEEKIMQMTLADGRTQTTEILTISVDIGIQGKVIATQLIILKYAKGNRTLLGIGFLTAAGIVLDLQRKQWYFTESSHRKYNFVKAS
ncbi:uncharacterized protein TNCV_3874191 [Trichonephila clavipes]|nr:uncharacterized protein TNCV_3874191 [Trichonephila clavipes]